MPLTSRTKRTERGEDAAARSGDGDRMVRRQCECLVLTLLE
jgi:hypothetical protein